MAKSLVLSLLVLGLLGNSAFASKSRMSSLGQDVNGSLFIEDHRNIFLNPAAINQLGSSANFEFGPSNSGAEPKAEGGLLRQHNDFNVAVQLGRRSQSAIRMAQTLSLFNTGTGIIAPQNGLDVIVGSKAGLNWGAGIHYTNSSSKVGDPANFPDSESSTIAVRGGADFGQASAFVGLDLKNSATNETAAGVKEKHEGKTSFDVGGVLNLTETSKVGGQVEWRKADLDNGAATRGSSDLKILSANYYSELPTKAGVMMFYTAGLRWVEFKFDREGAGQTDGEQSSLALPLSLGVEMDAKEWMKLRASVRQNVILDTVKDKNNSASANQRDTSNLDDTTVAAGLGLKLGDFTLDALIAGAGNGEIDGDSLLTHASLHYNF